MSYRKVLNRRALKSQRNRTKMEEKGFVFEKPCYSPNIKVYTHLKAMLERKKKAREQQLENEKRKKEKK